MGPLSSGKGAQERPAGWAQWIAPSSLPAQGCAVSKPPEQLCEVAGQDARRPLMWGALSFGYFSLSTQRKVTRSPEASEKRAWMPRSAGACFFSRNPNQSHWVPAFAGTTSEWRRMEARQGCSDPKERAPLLRIKKPASARCSDQSIGKQTTPSNK